MRLFKFETDGQTKQKISSKSSKNEIEILPSPDTGDEYKETAYGRGYMQYQHRCVLTYVVRPTLSQVMCCIISGCGRRIFGYIYVKHFIALRGRRETNMLRKQPQKQGEIARFHFNVYFELWFLVIFGNETNLKTSTSKFHTETPEHV